MPPCMTIRDMLLTACSGVPPRSGGSVYHGHTQSVVHASRLATGSSSSISLRRHHRMAYQQYNFLTLSQSIFE